MKLREYPDCVDPSVNDSLLGPVFGVVFLFAMAAALVGLVMNAPAHCEVLSDRLSRLEACSANPGCMLTPDSLQQLVETRATMARSCNGGDE